VLSRAGAAITLIATLVAAVRAVAAFVVRRAGLCRNDIR
jgi:hypothetical protein